MKFFRIFTMRPRGDRCYPGRKPEALIAERSNFCRGKRCVPSDPRYGHVRNLLRENFSRYGKPLFIAETGIEDKTRQRGCPTIMPPPCVH